ncbi:MAG: hypothetical protein ABFD92_00440 [Planctomycetaceae bacterium]|nr:hypothetical protein [Planctomycetaceae bacterium]
MNGMVKIAAVFCAVAVLALGAGAMAAPKGKKGKSPRIELPDAVRASMNNVIPGSAITRITLQTRDGVEVYHALLTKSPAECRVAVAADGTLIAVVTPVKEADLPQPVKDTLAAQAKDAVLLETAKAEISAEIKDAKVTVLDKPKTRYEAEVRPTAGAAIALEIAPDGTLIKKEQSKQTQKPANAAKKSKAARKQPAAAGE